MTCVLRCSRKPAPPGGHQSANQPTRRVGHSMDLVEGSFGGPTAVVLWGKGGATYHSDAYALRVREQRWEKPKQHGKPFSKVLLYTQ